MFDRTAATATLLVQNPWLEDPGLWPEGARRRIPVDYQPRSQYGTEIDERGGRDRAVVVVGPRQSGKSTFLWKRLLAEERPPVMVNCEEPILREAAASPALLWDWLRSVAPSPSAIFLEEVQHLDEAGLLLKGLIDMQVPCAVFATGSSAWDLRARTRESLAGRATRIRLWPFSASESAGATSLAPAIRRMRFHESVLRQLVVGGYPAVWRSGEPGRELSALVEAFLIRDASDVYKVEDTGSFRRLLRFAAASIGNLVNLAEWAAAVELDRRTVRRYLDFMQDAHLLRLVDPFVGGKRAELTGTPKLYFVDNGLRNSLRGALAPWSERTDQGELFENFVFGELSKALPWTEPLRYWRSKGRAEVDFVLEVGQSLIGVEAKAGSVDRGPSRGAWSFMAAYRPAEFWTIYLGETREDERDRMTLRWLHPADLGEHLRRVAGGPPRLGAED